MPQGSRRRVSGYLEGDLQDTEKTREIITKNVCFEMAHHPQITYMNRTLNRFPDSPFGR
jgi:hypothetical protein